MKKIFVLIFCSWLTIAANAQEGLEAGFMLGMSHYFGDLNTKFYLGDPGPSFGVMARYNFNKRICLKFSGSYGRVSADDAKSTNEFERSRNLSFRSDILDGTGQIEFNFLPYTHGSIDEFFTPYIFGGISIIQFEPEAEFEGEWVRLQPLGTEGQFIGEEYSRVAGGFAYGGGLKLSMSYEWSINLELSVRHLFTDYLDDVSGFYPDSEDLLDFRSEKGELAKSLSDRSGEVGEIIGEAGRQRGNSGERDFVGFLSASIIYYFGDLKCPTISR